MLAAIDSIYAAAEGQRSWRAALEHVAAAVGASGATLAQVQVQARSLGVVESTIWDRQALDYYERELIDEDPITPSLRNVPIGAATLSHEVLDSRVWTRTRMYAELYAPANLLHAMAGTFARDGDDLGVLIFTQDRSGSVFTRDQARQVELLLPHFARAARIGQLLSATRAEAEIAGRGLLFLDRRARVLAISASVEAVLAGLERVGVERGQLTVHDPAVARWLGERLASDSVEASAGVLCFQDGDASCRLELVACPRSLRWTHPGPPPELMLLVSRQRAAIPLPNSLVEIAELIAEGLSDKEIAERTGRSLATVRTYVARLYQRTGQRSRSALTKWWLTAQ